MCVLDNIIVDVLIPTAVVTNVSDGMVMVLLDDEEVDIGIDGIVGAVGSVPVEVLFGAVEGCWSNVGVGSSDVTGLVLVLPKDIEEFSRVP